MSSATSCIPLLVVSGSGHPGQLLRAMGCFEKEAAKIVNPDIEIKTVQLMTDGDPCCRFSSLKREKGNNRQGDAGPGCGLVKKKRN